MMIQTPGLVLTWLQNHDGNGLRDWRMASRLGS